MLDYVLQRFDLPVDLVGHSAATALTSSIRVLHALGLDIVERKAKRDQIVAQQSKMKMATDGERDQGGFA